MTIQNQTRTPSTKLRREMNEVCDVMGWPRYRGTLSVSYHDQILNRWSGETSLGPMGADVVIWIRYSLILLWIRTSKDAPLRRYVFGPRRCRQIAMVHELGHVQGLTEAQCDAAEFEFATNVGA